MQPPRSLRILHFNDVYELNSRKQEPVGGAARFVSLVKQQASAGEGRPLILFSGDCINPSMLSTVTKGKQMEEVLNAVGVHAACVGNHDFDFGLEPFLAIKSASAFPWLLSNVAERASGEPLGGCLRSHLMEWEGLRVGLMGLVEPEWLETLPSLNPEDLVYTDFVECGRGLALELLAQGADVVVALTHMRRPNDRVLAAEVPEIDLVLGGHDHDYSAEASQPHGTPLVKSGTDFRDLSAITLTLTLSPPLEGGDTAGAGAAAATADGPSPGSAPGSPQPHPVQQQQAAAGSPLQQPGSPLGSPQRQQQDTAALLAQRGVSPEDQRRLLQAAAARLMGTSLLRRRSFQLRGSVGSGGGNDSNGGGSFAGRLAGRAGTGGRAALEGGRAALGGLVEGASAKFKGLLHQASGLLGPSQQQQQRRWQQEEEERAGKAAAEVAPASGATEAQPEAPLPGTEGAPLAAAAVAAKASATSQEASAAADGAPASSAAGEEAAGVVLRTRRPAASGLGTVAVECVRLGVTSDVAEDPAAAEIVERYNAFMGASMGQEVGFTAVDLDGRFESVRTSESNLGNFVCDVLREACHCDVVLINSGTLRSDAIHPAGKLTNKDLVAIMPMMDETIVVEVCGAQLLAALENGVSQYPMLEGRFPQVSGIEFAFDPAQPHGSRVVPGSVLVGGEPLKEEGRYSLGTKEYLAEGRDGYDCLAGAPVLLDSECAAMLPTAVRNHFTTLAVLNKWVEVPTWRLAAQKLLQRARPSGQQLAGAASRAAQQNPVTGIWEIAPAVEGRIRNVAQEAQEGAQPKAEA